MCVVWFFFFFKSPFQWLAYYIFRQSWKSGKAQHNPGSFLDTWVWTYLGLILGTGIPPHSLLSMICPPFQVPLSKYPPAKAQQSLSSQPQSKGGVLALWKPSLDACFRLEIQFREEKKEKEEPVFRAFREWSKPSSSLLSSASPGLPWRSSNSHRPLLPFFRS